jgi:hypothetical protein
MSLPVPPVPPEPRGLAAGLVAPPRPAAAAVGASSPTEPGNPPDKLFEFSGYGFVPGEDVQVAIILRETSARMDGRARALVTNDELGHARRVILMGSVSGTMLISPAFD